MALTNGLQGSRLEKEGLLWAWFSGQSIQTHACNTWIVHRDRVVGMAYQPRLAQAEGALVTSAREGTAWRRRSPQRAA